MPPGRRAILIVPASRQFRSVDVLTFKSAAASFIVYQTFGTSRPWHEYLLFELTVVAVGCSVLPLLYTAAREVWAGFRACEREGNRRVWLARTLRPGFVEAAAAT